MRPIVDKIKSLFSGSKSKSPQYEQEKKIACGNDLKAKVSLAGNSKTHQEILYYLAEHDEDDEIRKALAKNKSTPIQASPILAGSDNAQVRLALAERLIKLLPELNQERHSQLYAFAVQALGTLALDEVLKIRKALSSALYDYGDAPPDVVGQLARDIEQEVSEPILKYCTAVSDDVLLEILKAHPATWAIQAIAGRKKVSDIISKAVIKTGDKAGGSTLICNEGADIGGATLEEIIERAREYPEWQTHLASRASLPPKMAKKLAQFADRSVQKVLASRTDFDPQTIEEITEAVNRRIGFASDGERSLELSPSKRAEQMMKQGKLNEETLGDALGMRDREFLYAALAQLADTDIEIVEKVFSLKAAKPVIALSWKSKLSMRFALRLQKEVANIQPKELVYPRDGTDYPMTHDELVWQLDFLGIKAA